MDQNIGIYPEPVVVAPHSGQHKQTFIVLHGRGDTAGNFGPQLLDWYVTDHQTLRRAFQNAKFVFPGAALRRVQISGLAVASQWFDSGHPGRDQGKHYDDLQIEGLRESTKYLHGLMRDAIAEVGASNLIVGGLSQGGATTLTAMLLWEGEPIGCWFGLCSRLPFRPRIKKAIDELTRNSGRALELVAEDVPKTAKLRCARDWLYRELEFPDSPVTGGSRNEGSRGPIFLGHGTLDPLVPLHLGSESALLLEMIGLKTDWHQYDGLGHWYSPDMLKDLIEFISAGF
ncbi:hypothetical protein DV735_g1310, partial [Chaetothyriales sp. CBS 134920]